ncbi:MAG: PAS domain-containing protein, partial [Actinobacteria bacterium]|nr:PAS domain-containing protein [Actinomycetota bacterium]
MFETDTDFRLLAANDAFRDLALGGGSVVQGTAPWSHAVPHVRTECERAWLAHSGDPASFTCEFPVPSPDGSTVWVRLNSAARLDGGRIIGWVGSAVDVTPVVEQSSLSDQLVGLLDVSGDAVVVFDRVGSLTFANDTARSLLGVDPTRTVADDIAARTYMQAVRDQLPRFMLETGAAATNRWEGEIAFRSPDGLPRTLTVIVQVVRESDGTVHHWATIAR